MDGCRRCQLRLLVGRDDRCHQQQVQRPQEARGRHRRTPPARTPGLLIACHPNRPPWLEPLTSTSGPGLPTGTTKNVHLEVALAARRLALQEFVDLHIHMYEEIVYIGIYKASEDATTLAFLNWLETLYALLRSTLTSPQNPPLLSRRSVARRTELRRRRSYVDGCIFLLASCNHHCDRIIVALILIMLLHSRSSQYRHVRSLCSIQTCLFQSYFDWLE